MSHDPKYGDPQAVLGVGRAVISEKKRPVISEKKQLSLNDYQREALATDASSQHGFPYYALGVAGEAGEVAEKVKKFLRDDDGVLTFERSEAIKKELGDVLWYVAVLAYRLGYMLEDVAQTNIDKLQKRQVENKLKGDGDDR